MTLIQENVFALIAMDKYFRTYEADEPNFATKIWLGFVPRSYSFTLGSYLIITRDKIGQIGQCRVCQHHLWAVQVRRKPLMCQ
jgi:hypothetical protein